MQEEKLTPFINPAYVKKIASLGIHYTEFFLSGHVPSYPTAQ